MSRLTYLGEIDYYDPADSTTKTLRVSTLGYTSLPGDTPANAHYASRLIQPGLVRRDIFRDGATSGAIIPSYGLVELVNTGDLDALIECFFDGRQYRLKLGAMGQPIATFTTILTATIEQAEFTLKRLQLRLKDPWTQLDSPVSQSKYLGNNTPPNGLEGSEDLKDAYKPRMFGYVLHAAPILVNASKLIYQVNDGDINQMLGVWDNGAQVSPGADYTSEAQMLSTAPTAGYYRTWKTGGYIRLGSAPTGQITFSAATEANPLSLQIGTQMKALAMAAGIPEPVINASDVTALDNMSNNAVGIWLQNGETAREAMTSLANSMSLYFGFDRSGQLRMKEFREPQPNSPGFYQSDLTLTAADLISLERVVTSDPGGGIPAKACKLRWGRNYSVQTDGLAGSVTADRRAWLKEEWRQSIVENATNKSLHPLAPEIALDTCLVYRAHAEYWAGYYLSLYAKRRDRFNLRVRTTPGIHALDLDSVVTLQLNRWGLNAGKNFKVIGIESDYAGGRIDLMLWG